MPNQTIPGSLLVVDDNENNRDMLVRILQRQGHRTEIAVNGREALEKIRHGNFDLILLDIMMPEMDGFQVLGILKADSVLREIPVIVLSAIQEMDAIIRCIKMGADDYLPKPLDLTLLRARVGASVERKRVHEREKQLLLNILPARIAEELQEKGSVEPRHLEEVTILFTDFVRFSDLTRQLSAADLVRVLHDCFTQFDHIVARYKLEKLKTIGDSYMMAGGLQDSAGSHPVDAVLAAFEMVEVVKKLEIPGGLPLGVRIGIHAGPVIAGVVGVHKFAFDIWGDAVNFGARLEACSLPNRINLSARVRELVGDFIQCESRGYIETKDLRTQEMYFAESIRQDEFAERYRQRFGHDPYSLT